MRTYKLSVQHAEYLKYSLIINIFTSLGCRRMRKQEIAKLPLTFFFLHLSLDAITRTDRSKSAVFSPIVCSHVAVLGPERGNA